MNTFMDKEDYVSIETAKLLKEKNFNWITTRSFLASGVFAPCDITEVPINENNIRIPTLQMAMKWLREKHNLSITVFLLNVVDGEYIGYHADIELMAEWIENLNKFKKVSLGKTFHSYEQACEAAIKYCLENLI